MGITDCLQNNTTHGSSILMYSRSVGFSVLEWRSRGCRFNPRTAALLETQVAYSGALNYFYDIPYKSCARKPAIATRGQRSSVGIPHIQIDESQASGQGFKYFYYSEPDFMILY